MGHDIIRICSVLGVFSISPENKPAVPVGYHTPCRSVYRESNVSGIYPQSYGHNEHCVQQTNALEDSVLKAQSDGNFPNVLQRSRDCCGVSLAILYYGYCPKHCRSRAKKREKKKPNKFLPGFFNFIFLYFPFAIFCLIVGIHWLRAERLVLLTDYGSGLLLPVGY